MRAAFPILLLMALAGCQEEFADWPEPETADAALGDGFAAAFRAGAEGAPVELGSVVLTLDPGVEPIDLN